MTFLIASDIHGSAYYANIIVDAYKKHQADNLLLLGDILYHGPRNELPKDYAPKEVIALLNPLQANIIACRGNCDSEVDQMVLDFPLMSTSQSIPYGKHKIVMSHGHVYGPDQLPKNLVAGDIFMSGHTHIPVMKKEHDITLINPGSISLPKENNPHTYGLLVDQTYYWYNDQHELLATLSL